MSTAGALKLHPFGHLRSVLGLGAVALAVLTCAGLAMPGPAVAEVRFGKNVRVGGHDFSNQTFNAQRRGRVYLYDRKPKRPGCVWKADKRGGRVKVCHLQRR